MRVEEVEVIIHPDGRVEIQVFGAEGAKCLDITRDLEAALGNQIESRTMTTDAVSTVQEEVAARETAHTGRG
ncbi:DUF2997 domain-containing protein [Synechococcus sp. RC10A2]|uniref:DUF2997 domain-containing protein n=1 Tax=Synechococcus sp. RC10A2 TaxID=2964529 RepID=UPI0039C616F8